MEKELTRSRVANCISDCAEEYGSLMATQVMKLRTVEELMDVHEKAKSTAIDHLIRTCPSRDPTLLKKYEEELRNRIEEDFEERKDIFELKRTEEEEATKGMLTDARQSYHSEMEKHFKNNFFITPSQLHDEFHFQAKTIVMNKCEKKTPLSHFQRADLEKALDALLEIYEKKNDMNLNSGDLGVAPAIGIDLGTTYCCVAVYYRGKVHIIPNQEKEGNNLTPSYVAFGSDGSTTCGAAAKDNAYRDQMNTIYDVRRIIGRKMSDPKLQEDMRFWPFVVQEDEGVPKVMVNGNLFHPEQISGILLAQFRVMAEKFLKLNAGTIRNAVITVPAYFNDGQRQATVDAGELAGYGYILTILNEPAAAALAYSLERLDVETKKILIYDLSDRSFDVTVLIVKPKEIEVLGVNGDSHLGGDDFVRKLMEYCASRFQSDSGIDLFDGKDSSIQHDRDEANRRMRRLQYHCEVAMRYLMSARATEVCVDSIINGLDLIVSVTREKFEELNMFYFEKTIKLVGETLQGIDLRREEIDDVILVGGSSGIPKVQEMLKTFFGGKALNCSIDPDFVVAYGAAVQAAMLNGKEAKLKMGHAYTIVKGKDDDNPDKKITTRVMPDSRKKELEAQQKYDVMRAIATKAVTQLKSMVPDATQEWLQLHLSPGSIANISNIYDHALREVLSEGHKHVHTTLWDELDRLVDLECRNTCTLELSAVSRQIQKFYVGMKNKFDFVQGVPRDDLEMWGKEELYKVLNSDPIPGDNPEITKLVNIGCLKLIEHFRAQNVEISNNRDSFVKNLIRDGLHFYDEEMTRLLRDAVYPSERLQEIHAALSEKLTTALDQSIKLMAGENKANAFKSSLEKCFAGYQKQNNMKLQRIRKEVETLLEASQSSYVSKIEKLIEENPNGLETTELYKRHMEIVSETEEFLETEIGNKIVEGEPLDKHSKSLQAYVQEYWKYISDINNLNLKRGELRQHKEARMQSIRNRLRLKEGESPDDQAGLMSSKLPVEVEVSTPNLIPEAPREIGITSASTSKAKEELLKQCHEMRKQLESGAVFQFKSGVVKGMFAEKIEKAIRIAEDPDSTFGQIQEQVETLVKWRSKYRK